MVHSTSLWNNFSGSTHINSVDWFSLLVIRFKLYWAFLDSTLFSGYSLYRSHSSHSFDTCTISVPSIASNLYWIYCAILFQELSLMAALENLRILHHLKGVDSITIWWHIALLETNIYQQNKPVEASLPLSTIFHWHILIQQLQFYQDIKRM